MMTAWIDGNHSLDGSFFNWHRRFFIVGRKGVGDHARVDRINEMVDKNYLLSVWHPRMYP